MSGRFVRASSFRHVHGVAEKPDGSFLQAQIQCSGDGNYVAGNAKYFCYSGRGGGGPVYVLNRDAPGRLSSTLPKLEVHRGKVLDFAFNPFNDNVLATASEDCQLKISIIPDGGLKATQSTAAATLSGHEKKVTAVTWHPTTNNVLASAAFDRTVKVWDVESQQAIYSPLDGVHGEAVQHISWNRNGSLLATACKDKVHRVFDPRSEGVVSSKSVFGGSKKSSVVFMDNLNLIACVGFTRSSTRQVQLFDPRNMSTAAYSTDIDQSAGVLCVNYDYDTKILFMGGKGDSSIKYWEMVNTSPYMHFLSSFSDNQSQKGVCFLPKTSCDTTKCEIASALRVMRDSIIPVHFCVPRKSSDLFQSDLFPDAYAGISAQDSKAYQAGENADPVTTSMKPGQRRTQEASELVVKASYAELEEENAALKKRIAELEAQLN